MYFLRQQYSLWTVTQAFKEHKDEYAAAIYLRPDVRFLDKLDVNALSQIVNGNSRTIATPSWHTWHGVNDRFAMGKPADMVTYGERSEEHTSELQSLMRISYAVFCLKKNKNTPTEKPNK